MAGWWSAPRTPCDFMTSHAPASVTEAWVFLLSLYVSVNLFPRERERERERERGKEGGREKGTCSWFHHFLCHHEVQEI